ncbi:hypothetical protein KGM_207963 [Danaus plexippus plexippus]|uniref:Peptidase S1 domain-containing protein n=1 Tax=Danaus plexippus plexippus TaxID=278856 RepID=A0A212EZT8_DANPL|nr:hypothetical protein KGM_207963 [Danaus plexippus plexippus]
MSGKWQVGRVSRKQYEIINMLWKKTKIFVETEEKGTSTTSQKLITRKKRLENKIGKHVTLAEQNPLQEAFQLAQPKSAMYSSTPSFIEFYYLDEFDDRISRGDTRNKNKQFIVTKSRLSDKIEKAGLSRSPLFLFRVNDATCRATTYDLYPKNSAKTNTKRKVTKSKNHINSKRPKTVTVTTKKNRNHDKYRSTPTLVAINNNMHSPSEHLKNYKYKTKTSNLKTYTLNKRTIANDHIRFFEIYDSDVNTPYMIAEDGGDRMIERNEIRNEEKIYLHHIDHGGKHDDLNNTRYVKKHINHKTADVNMDTESLYEPTFIINDFLRPTTKVSSQNRSSLWSEFPFVAVYVYEPNQVRCDSASISPHWLVASATCLNRHHRDIKLEGRSAFVSYCSGNWRHPGRIAYVKQSLLHPRFHPKDNSRRQLYNIGAIQVVNSMADTCSGWAPVSLMSHQFVASSDGSLATALGWGLDKFDERYSQSPLPKHLTLNEGIVYSIPCPGSNGYNTPKGLDEGNFKNLYCLSLYPYTESNVSTHGSLLLIGGKLIALYTQHDRQSWSNQYSQYTGIWRLIPWLLEVAKEPEEHDHFNLDM